MGALDPSTSVIHVPALLLYAKMLKYVVPLDVGGAKILPLDVPGAMHIGQARALALAAFAGTVLLVGMALPKGRYVNPVGVPAAFRGMGD